MRIQWLTANSESITKLFKKNNVQAKSGTRYSPSIEEALFLYQLTFDAEKGYRVWSVVGSPFVDTCKLDALRPAILWQKSAERAIKEWRKVVELDLHTHWRGLKIAQVFLNNNAKADRDYTGEVDRREGEHFEASVAKLISLPTQF